MVGCGIFFVVGGVVSRSRVVMLCRVGWRSAVWLSCGCGVASCRSMCCVVLFCGVGWCLVVPGVGSAMPRFVLFLAVGCAVHHCAMLCGVV